MKYDAAQGLLPLDPAADCAANLAPGAHVRLTATAPALTGDLSVRTLNLAGGASTPLGVTVGSGNRLTLADGGILKSGFATASIDGGTLASGTGELVVY